MSKERRQAHGYAIVSPYGKQILLSTIRSNRHESWECFLGKSRKRAQLQRQGWRCVLVKLCFEG